MREKKAIVTGATSFIGIALIDRLLAQNFEVAAIVRPGSAGLANLGCKPHMKLVESQLSQLREIEIPGFENSRMLYHIGWSSDFPNARYHSEGQMRNVSHTIQAVEMARRHGCRTFLCVGSQAECGLVDAPIGANTPARPQNAYARAKCMAAEQSRILCERYGIKQCWPRLLSAYGPYDRPHTLIMSCLRACRRNTPIDLTLCTQIWDYVHVSDVATALSFIAERGRHGVKYPIASGVGMPLINFINTICEVTSNDILLAGVGKKEFQRAQIMHLSGDISLTASHTGFAPKTAFKRGIEQLWRMVGSNHE